MDRMAVMDDAEERSLILEALLDRHLGAVRTFALDPNHPEQYDAVRSGLQAILQPAGNVQLQSRVENRRVELEKAFHDVGLLVGVTIPTPLINGKEISNREFERRAGKKQALFVQPPKHLWTYDGHMTAFGQGGHWTVTNNVDEVNRAKIVWESVNDWSWFWAEVSLNCRRRGTPWNTLTKKIRLLSLEKYVLVWHLHKAITGKMLDVVFWCWLRTVWNVSGALNANEYDGEVDVRRYEAENLSIAYDHVGGRVAEVIH